ncbi:hypothetical protein AB0J86_38085 [Micromonospora sp. NPDC049559]|uniref:hypothetical protein n=1 Tax=Micromonospora sp. NPDC049559 TaxID=3155923 RepID=UPI003447345C
MMVIAVALLTGLVGAAVPAAAASADPPTLPKPFEMDDAVSGGSPSGGVCTTTIGNDATGCFVRYGDQWFVQAIDPDAAGGTSISWSNELYAGSSRGWVTYRHGTCYGWAGVGTWVHCNKDYYENTSENYFGYQGSRLRWTVCANYCSEERVTTNDQ